MTAAVPMSTLTSDQLLKLANFRRDLADDLDGAFGAVGAASDYADVTDYGATGDGVTDDKAFIQLAVDAAVAGGLNVYFPAGTYKTVGYIYLRGARGMRIFGAPGASIRFSSDNAALVPDTYALSNAHARSAFYLQFCTDVLIENLTGVGADSTNLTINCGNFVSARNCVGTALRRCTARGGYAIFNEDAQGDITGTGDSIAVASGVATLTDAAGTFNPGMVDRRVAIAGASTAGNNITARVTAYVSPTQIRYANANAAAETSSFTWSVDLNDRGTSLINCYSDGTRGTITPGNDFLISGGATERPTSTIDAVGIVDEFSIAGTTVTLTDRGARFKPSHHGKIVTVSSALIGGNNVTARLTYISSTQVSYTNATGAADYGWRVTRWWIANGERVGRGAGAGAISVTAGVVTLTVDTASFVASDVGMPIRIAVVLNSGNQGIGVITEVVSPTVVKYANSIAVNENFTGIWSIDSYDNGPTAVDTYGSTHGLYVFAGRSNVAVRDCVFRGIRSTAVKASGSSLPVQNVSVTGCTFIECGSVFVVGADDLQDHTGLTFEGNTVIDCSTGSVGRTQATIINVYGARNVNILNNRFHYTRDAVGAVDGRGTAGNYAVVTSVGSIQPLEDLVITGNNFSQDDTNCTINGVGAVSIRLLGAGLRGRWNTAGTLTKSGDYVTLLAQGPFEKQDIGKFMNLPLAADAGNVGTFEVVAVPSSTTITFYNPAGVGGSVNSGVWKLRGRTGYAGSCRIQGNTFGGTAPVAVQATDSVGLEIVDNTFTNGGVYLTGCVSPRIQRNRQIATNTQLSQIRLFDGVAWPIISDNTITNQAIGTVSGWDVQVGDSAGTDTDYPLLGNHGRCVPTEGRTEVVVAYGGGHVDGDTITVDGNVFTYIASAPGAGQFNSFAGLVALIEALANYTCADYGLPWTITTQHLKIRRSAASTAADQFAVSVSTLYPTALALLRNSTGTHLTCLSRGEESGAGVGDAMVVWSPLASYIGHVNLTAENTAARALLQANGFYVQKNAGRDAGCNEVVRSGDAAGTEQFRWSIG